MYYGSTEFNAHTLIDVATLTGYVPFPFLTACLLTSLRTFHSAVDIALGEPYSGVFTVWIACTSHPPLHQRS